MADKDYDNDKGIWIDKPDPKIDEIKRRKERYQHVFGTENGAWVLEDLKKHFGFYTASFRPGQTAPVETTIYLEGQRSVALAIDLLAKKE